MNTDLPARLRLHVQTLAGDIGDRHHGLPDAYQAAADHILDHWKQLGQVPNIQTYDASGHAAHNLVVELPGVTQPDQIIILGAHYDTCPSGLGNPGADDNASAVAGLLEAGRQLIEQHAKTPFAKTLRLVAFANEEPPYFHSPSMGSKVYADQCVSAHESITAMICLEMIGYYDDAHVEQHGRQHFPDALLDLLPDHEQFIAAVGDENSQDLLATFTKAFRAATDFELFPHASAPAAQALWLSDHGPFWDHNIPALMITDTSMVRNPHYHQPTDLPDTLDYDNMAEVVKGTAAVVGELLG